MIIEAVEYTSTLAAELLTNPVLQECASGRKNIILTPRYDTFLLVGFADENYPAETLIGGVEVRTLTDKVVDLHIYVLPQHWGTGLGRRLARKSIEWLIENTTYDYGMTETPGCCVYAKNFVEDLGFFRIHIFKNGVTYRDKQEDLVVYRLNFNRAGK
jgi:GNAT superfamily N-acetyltransferase